MKTTKHPLEPLHRDVLPIMNRIKIDNLLNVPIIRHQAPHHLFELF